MGIYKEQADVIIVGAGLAGLAAACEVLDRGGKVIIVDQEPEASLGGQAYWSLGGLFLVNTPEQRRLGIHDSKELAWRDWQAVAGFDRDEDFWPRKWAQAYVDFAAGEMHGWLKGLGIRFIPIVGWAERGGNSVPRFHIAWGSGPGVVDPFIIKVKAAQKKGLLKILYRHKVTELLTREGVVVGVKGQVLELSNVERGALSSRKVSGDFSIEGQAVIIAAGGIGGNHELVRQFWPARLGKPPKDLLSGVPESVDGSMLGVAKAAGARIINSDRMWHYPEGIRNYAPVWSKHAIRILSGPTPLWLDALGKRLPAPLFPGYDALGALEAICKSGYGHSWFLLNQPILNKEFALSGSEQNPDMTARSWLGFLKRSSSNLKGPIAKFQEFGADFVTDKSISGLVEKMNLLVGEDLLDGAKVEEIVRSRDEQVDSGFGKDPQINGIRDARRYIGDRYFRTAKLGKIAGEKLVAVRLSVLTRKTLGGIECDLCGRSLRQDGKVIEGLYAAGEAAGFGGGGMHGYRSLEGTFLGGCLFSGRIAGRQAIL